MKHFLHSGRPQFVWQGQGERESAASLPQCKVLRKVDTSTIHLSPYMDQTEKYLQNNYLRGDLFFPLDMLLRKPKPPHFQLTI